MLTILTGKDNKILRTPAKKVAFFDEKLTDTVDLMIDTMLNPEGQDVTGIGLAAPQVGIAQNIIIVTLNVNAKKDPKIVVMINPEIIESSEATTNYEEGCLSLPGAYGRVTRPAKVKVKWQNEKGNWCERKFEKWDARIFLHEYDHLIGKLFIDYLSPEEVEKLKEKKKL
jgi:peptide deformylase